MNTEKLYPLIPDNGTLALFLKKLTNGKMTILVDFKYPEKASLKPSETEQAALRQPLILTGTPEEIAINFYELIAETGAAKEEFFNNLTAIKEANKKAEEEAKKNKKTATSSTATATTKPEAKTAAPKAKTAAPGELNLFASPVATAPTATSENDEEPLEESPENTDEDNLEDE